MVERGRERGAVRSASEAQRQRNGDERRASGTTSSRVHFARGGLVCDECRGRQLLPWSPLPHRQIAISTRRGATVSLHLCLCVLPTHVNRSSSSCTASLFADDDDDDAGQSAVCSAPCSTPTARRRAASARRRPGVCTTRARRSSSCVVGRRRALPARIGGARRQERRRVRAAARSRPSSVKFDEVGARPCTSTATPTRTALGDGGSAMELGAKFNSNALLIGVLLLKCRSTSLIVACRSSSVHVAVPPRPRRRWTPRATTTFASAAKFGELVKRRHALPRSQ